jgi:hypothetical protein
LISSYLPKIFVLAWKAALCFCASFFNKVSSSGLKKIQQNFTFRFLVEKLAGGAERRLLILQKSRDKSSSQKLKAFPF